MKNTILNELRVWLRGRFALSSEEKFWLLIILIIIWVGLLGRYLHQKSQTVRDITKERIEMQASP